MWSTRRQQSRGFTLIELLVVIAVIALLIGILLPALGKARSQGQSAKCQGHHRQYGTAHQIYITDYDVMPGLGNGDFSSDPSSPVWVTETGVFGTDYGGLSIDVDEGAAHHMNRFPKKYLRDPHVTTCPADPMVRHYQAGNGFNERLGNMLTPEEDPQAVGTSMTRLWFNFQPQNPPPFDYVVSRDTVYVTINGLTEQQDLEFMRPDRLTLPALSADSVEEDEDSILNNSIFVAEPHAWGYPPTPGNQNIIADRHPAKSGNIVYHDGHVNNIADIHAKYWAEPDYETRIEILWWPYYKDNDDGL